MDILFVLIAVCPAVVVTKYELKREVSWRLFLSRFAEWFYATTFVNFILMYLRGWGSFDFTSLTVQFLTKYMLSSFAVIILVWLGKRVMGNILHGGDKAKEGDGGNGV